MVLQKLGDKGYVFWCPACKEYHRITDSWYIRYDHEFITVRPSIRVKCDGYWSGREFKSLNCHLFITNSRLEYLSDCTHEMAGMTVDMVDIDSLRSI